jgi:Ca2+:H+ antiporter
MNVNGSGTPRLDARFFFGYGWPYLLTPLIPLAIALDIANASAGLVFAVSALGIIPTAALMGRATEELAARSGPGIGGLLNVTFGNAPELIIALFALGQGLHEVVKASLVGSVIGNTLLVMGAAFFVGGLGRKEQTFSPTAVSVQTTMLLAAATAMVMPGIFELVEGKGLPAPGAERVGFGSTVEHLSLVVAGILIVVYVAGLVFSLRTHRDVFNPEYEDEDSWGWSTRTSILMLAIAGVAVGVMSEVLVGSISEASHSLGLSEAMPPSTGSRSWSRARTRWISRSASRSAPGPRSPSSSPRCWSSARSSSGRGRCRWSSTASSSAGCCSRPCSPTT